MPKNPPKTKHAGGRTPIPGLRRRPIGLPEEQWAWLTEQAAAQNVTVDAWLRAKLAQLMAK